MVRLVPMNATEYQAYLDISIREYAEDKVQAGNWQPEEALENSVQEFQKLLPDEVATRDHCLYYIEDETLGVKLHVFGFNHSARALYEKLGYEITNINMAKKLTA